MMPKGKQTNLTFMSVVILSSADVRSVSMLQLHVIKVRQTDMKGGGNSVVFRVVFTRLSFITRRIVT